jgi:hypothetical protein
MEWQQAAIKELVDLLAVLNSFESKEAFLDRLKQSMEAIELLGEESELHWRNIPDNVCFLQPRIQLIQPPAQPQMGPLYMDILGIHVLGIIWASEALAELTILSPSEWEQRILQNAMKRYQLQTPEGFHASTERLAAIVRNLKNE